jgi:hypothetical protein
MLIEEFFNQHHSVCVFAVFLRGFVTEPQDIKEQARLTLPGLFFDA